jgi:hypothetical protein
MNNNTPFFSKCLSILINNINKNGTCNDAEVCKEIAEYINSNEVGYYGDALFEFIYEHGEDEDDTYMGRDENGEKVYHSFNPETNWHERIRKELVALGYYKGRDIYLVPA